MKLRIEKEIFEKFPELVIGVVVGRDIDNRGASDELVGLIREKERAIRENFTTETLSQHPQIASWRAAYSLFGAKPKEYKCSVENLYRMVLKGIELRHINKIVDIYNYVSIKHMVPVGGDDIDKVDGDIRLGFAKGDEIFCELGSREIKNPKPGEVVYCDSKEVLCRRWNWRECDKSKMTEATKDVTLVVEGLPPITKEKAEEIAAELGGLVEKHCRGKITSYIMDIQRPEIEI